MSNDAVIYPNTTQNTSILIFSEVTGDKNIYTLVAINGKNKNIIAKKINYNSSISDKGKKIADEDFRKCLHERCGKLIDFHYPPYNNCSLIIENTREYEIYTCNDTEKNEIQTIIKGVKIELKAAQEFASTS